MWYNILPSFAIVTGVLAVPAVVMAGLHKLVYDNIHERDLQYPHQRFMYLRDERISGSPWKMHLITTFFQGLEAIPDEDPQQ